MGESGRSAGREGTTVGGRCVREVGGGRGNGRGCDFVRRGGRGGGGNERCRRARRRGGPLEWDIRMRGLGGQFGFLWMRRSEEGTGASAGDK
jgi:hypothetical protein